MQFEGQEESKNVEDRRGMGPKAAMVGGGSIIILILAMVFGINPNQLAQVIPGAGGPGAGGAQQKGEFKETAEERERYKMTGQVLASTEKVWEKLFREQGEVYQKPKLVVFRGRVDTACGAADSGVGPFYCPGDSNVYIDLSFYRDMESKLKAPGDFPQAYVVAHEVGHHVQRLLGYSKKVDQARGTRLENQMSVRLELQADYLAGVWAHHASKDNLRLNRDDLAKALNAAKQIGDDTLQRNAGRQVTPESFSHGSSEQRQKWFGRGFESGSLPKAKALFDLEYNDL